MEINLLSPFEEIKIQGEFVKTNNEFSIIFNSEKSYSKESLALTTFIGSIPSDDSNCVVWIVDEVKCSSDRKGDLILPRTRVELVLKRKLPEGSFKFKFNKKEFNDGKPVFLINPDDEDTDGNESLSQGSSEDTNSI
jgi:hypothetical protein